MEKRDTPGIIITGDGSPSLFIPSMNETYHSRHGAIAESMHVFIKTGLEHASKLFTPINLLEIGFGTGTNALLTAEWANQNKTHIDYTSLEPFPLDEIIIPQLADAIENSGHDKNLFKSLHEAEWGITSSKITEFTLTKIHNTLQDFTTNREFNLVYYDAFGPPAQPGMWVPQLFQKLHGLMEPGGILVTYCAKGQVRRDLEASRFIVERLPGPPMKREMLRATRK